MSAISMIMRYIIFALFLALTPAHTYAMDPEVKKAEEFLRGLDTVQAEFVQKASNGAQLTGTFYLNRPGRLRFEYNEIDDFIVADGVFIYFYDSELGEQTNALIGTTMADFLLRKDLRLSGDVSVQSMHKSNGMIAITLIQTDDTAAGTLQLIFSETPYGLRKWRVTDAQGLITDIELNDIEYDLDLPYMLFAYHKPKSDQPRYND